MLKRVLDVRFGGLWCESVELAAGKQGFAELESIIGKLVTATNHDEARRILDVLR